MNLEFSNRCHTPSSLKADKKGTYLLNLVGAIVR